MLLIFFICEKKKKKLTAHYTASAANQHFYLVCHIVNACLCVCMYWSLEAQVCVDLDAL